jgi:hypothetical protein
LINKTITKTNRTKSDRANARIIQNNPIIQINTKRRIKKECRRKERRERKKGKGRNTQSIGYIRAATGHETGKEGNT